MNHCIVYGSATLSRKYEVPKIKSYEKKWPRHIMLLMGSILQPTSYFALCYDAIIYRDIGLVIKIIMQSSSSPSQKEHNFNIHQYITIVIEKPLIIVYNVSGKTQITLFDLCELLK